MLKKMIVLVALGLLMAAPAAFAQNGGGAAGGAGGGAGGGGGRGGRGGNFDPAQWRQQRLDDLKTQMASNDDEWKVLQPKIEKLFDAQRDAMSARGGFGGGGRGGRGGQGGAATNQPESAVARAAADLRKVVEAKDATADDIKAKLAAFREARDKARADLAAAQKDLKELVTARQEAVLVSNGMLD